MTTRNKWFLGIGIVVLVLAAYVCVGVAVAVIWRRVRLSATEPTPTVVLATSTPTTVVVRETVEVPILQTVEVKKEVTRVIEKEVEKVVTATPEPEKLAASVSVTTTLCRDGESIGNELNELGRTPIGLGENVAVVEAHWQGEGFGGFDRIVLVIPALGNQYQAFLSNVEGIHMVRYCGTLTQVETYVIDPKTHVWAMRSSSADGEGNMPEEDEIPVYSVDLEIGEIKILHSAPDGPTKTEVLEYLEVVELNN